MCLGEQASVSGDMATARERDLADACRYRKTDDVARLLAAGVDPNVRRLPHKNPLESAIYASSDVAMVTMLLDAGAAINRVGTHGETPLLAALRTRRRAVAALLIERGADVHARTPFGTSALMEAAGEHQDEIVAMLLERGAQPNVADSVGQTALILAAGRGSVALITLLLDAGAYVNARSLRGITPLTKAVARTNHDVVDLLLDAGASADVARADGEVLLRRACWIGDDDVVTALLRAGAPLDDECRRWWPVYARTIDALGGADGVARAHREWIETLAARDPTNAAVQRYIEAQPGRHTKAARAALPRYAAFVGAVGASL